MRTKIWLGLAAATTVAVIAPTGAASAQSFGQSFFQKILGTEDDTPPINYSDRAPLVKPGKLDLPPPGSATTNESDPNWPNDPDEKKRKASGIIPKTVPKNGDGRLSPEEMANGKLTGPSAAVSDPNSYRIGNNWQAAPLKPSELQKRIDTGEDNTPLAVGQEPQRRALTDPPPGYRKPLASAPIAGDEPLPSEGNQTTPWYERMFKTPKTH